MYKGKNGCVLLVFYQNEHLLMSRSEASNICVVSNDQSSGTKLFSFWIHLALIHLKKV